MFAPCTVTLADPVPALFPLVNADKDFSSTDQASVRVPTPTPEVTDTRMLRRIPPAVLHTKLDVDSWLRVEGLEFRSERSGSGVEA
jgi:hypothetical protein